MASIKNWKLKASEPSGNTWFPNGLLNDVPSTSHLLFVVDGPSTQRQWLMILKSDIEGEHNWSSLSRTSDYGTYSTIGINTIAGYQSPIITSTTNVKVLMLLYIEKKVIQLGIQYLQVIENIMCLKNIIKHHILLNLQKIQYVTY